jgi:phage shock protein C
MQTSETQPVVAHKESLLGICQAIGDDFGFNPDILRVALAVSLLADPKITLIAYALAGVAVLASRLLTRRWTIAIRRPVRTRRLVDA